MYKFVYEMKSNWLDNTDSAPLSVLFPTLGVQADKSWGLEDNWASERQRASLSRVWELSLPNFKEVFGDFRCISRKA